VCLYLFWCQSSLQDPLYQSSRKSSSVYFGRFLSIYCFARHTIDFTLLVVIACPICSITWRFQWSLRHKIQRAARWFLSMVNKKYVTVLIMSPCPREISWEEFYRNISSHPCSNYLTPFLLNGSPYLAFLGDDFGPKVVTISWSPALRTKMSIWLRSHCPRPLWKSSSLSIPVGAKNVVFVENTRYLWPYAKMRIF